jgi:hypothetical protein
MRIGKSADMAKLIGAVKLLLVANAHNMWNKMLQGEFKHGFFPLNASACT